MRAPKKSRFIVPDSRDPHVIAEAIARHPRFLNAIQDGLDTAPQHPLRGQDFDTVPNAVAWALATFFSEDELTQ